MKIKLMVVCLILAGNIAGQQVPKGTNTIIVSGVTFKEVANKALDNGYTFDKIDSNLQTIRTNEFHSFVMDLRIKDSSVIIVGWRQDEYSKHLTRVVYGQAFDGILFPLAKNFALSFNKPVEYLKQ